MTASQDFQNWLDDYVTGRVRAAVSPLEDLLADSAETVSAQALVIADRDRQVVEQAAVIAARDATIVDLRTQLEAKPDPEPQPELPVIRTAANTCADIDRARAEKRLTVHPGNLIIKDGKQYGGLLVQGYVQFEGPGALRKSYVEGAQAAGVNSTGLVRCLHSNVRDALLEDVVINPLHIGRFDGIRGHDFTLRRVKIVNVVDGLGLHNDYAQGQPLNVVVEDSYVGELAYIHPDGSRAQTHNDCVQYHGGTGAIFRRTTLSAKYGSRGTAQPAPGGATPVATHPDLAVLMHNTHRGATGGHLYDACRFEGGYLPVSCGGGGDTAFLGTFRDTVMEPGGMVRAGQQPVTIWRKQYQTVTVERCTHPDGSPIFVRTNG